MRIFSFQLHSNDVFDSGSVFSTSVHWVWSYFLKKIRFNISHIYSGKKGASLFDRMANQKVSLAYLCSIYKLHLLCSTKQYFHFPQHARGRTCENNTSWAKITTAQVTKEFHNFNSHLPSIPNAVSAKPSMSEMGWYIFAIHVQSDLTPVYEIILVQFWC